MKKQMQILFKILVVILITSSFIACEKHEMEDVKPQTIDTTSVDTTSVDTTVVDTTPVVVVFTDETVPYFEYVGIQKDVNEENVQSLNGMAFFTSVYVPSTKENYAVELQINGDSIAIELYKTSNQGFTVDNYVDTAISGTNGIIYHSITVTPEILEFGQMQKTPVKNYAFLREDAGGFYFVNGFSEDPCFLRISEIYGNTVFKANFKLFGLDLENAPFIEKAVFSDMLNVEYNTEYFYSSFITFSIGAELETPDVYFPEEVFSFNTLEPKL